MFDAIIACVSSYLILIVGAAAFYDNILHCNYKLQFAPGHPFSATTINIVKIVS